MKETNNNRANKKQQQQYIILSALLYRRRFCQEIAMNDQKVEPTSLAVLSP